MRLTEDDMNTVDKEIDYVLGPYVHTGRVSRKDASGLLDHIAEAVRAPPSPNTITLPPLQIQ